MVFTDPLLDFPVWPCVRWCGCSAVDRAWPPPQISELERDRNFLEEIRREEQERQRLEDERRERRAEFKQRAAVFNHA